MTECDTTLPFFPPTISTLDSQLQPLPNAPPPSTRRCTPSSQRHLLPPPNYTSAYYDPVTDWFYPFYHFEAVAEGDTFIAGHANPPMDPAQVYPAMVDAQIDPGADDRVVNARPGCPYVILFVMGTASVGIDYIARIIGFHLNSLVVIALSTSHPISSISHSLSIPNSSSLR